MNNLQNEIDEIYIHSPSNVIISKRSSSNLTGTSIRKKQFLFYKKITSSKDMEKLAENISIITTKFLQNFPNYLRVVNFRNKYRMYLNGSYVDIVLLMKEFPEFNIFDYIGIMSLNTMSKLEKKKLFQARNNILLSILLVAKEKQLLEKSLINRRNSNSIHTINNDSIKYIKKGDNCFSLIHSIKQGDNNVQSNQEKSIFQNLPFLNNLADDIKMLIIDENSNDYLYHNYNSPTKSLVRKHETKFKNCSNQNKNEDNSNIDFDYEIELFFLALLDFKDKARAIKQKYNFYFLNFIEELNLPNKFSLDKMINEISIHKDITELNFSELIFIRKILSNAAKRKLYYGVEFFTLSSKLNIYLSEGRLWKNIGLLINKKLVYQLWMNYEKKIEEDKYIKQPQTIRMEYGKKLTELKNELFELNQLKEKNIYKINQNLFITKEIKKKCKLPFVISFKDLISVFLKYDLKELALYCIEEYFDKSKHKKIPIEIYNLCLDYDQEIAIDIFDRALNQSNIDESYMLAALMRKYFRFARCLLKFKKCRNFLNSPPPESENYMYIMYRQQNKIKHEEIMKILYNKGRKNGGDELITFLKEEIKHENEGNPSITPQSVKTSYILNIIAPEPNPAILKIMENNSSPNNQNVDNSAQHLVNGIDSFSNIIENFENMGTYKNNGINFNTVIEKNQHLKISSSPKTSDIKGNVNEDEKKYLEIINNMHNPESLGSRTKLFVSNKSLVLNPNSKLISPTLHGDKKIYIGSNNDYNTITKYLQNLKEQEVKTNNKTRKSYGRPLRKGLSLNLYYQKRKHSKYYQPVEISPRDSYRDSDEIRFRCLSTNKLPKINVQSILIDHLRFGEYLFDAICLLSSIKITYLNLDYVEKTCKNLLVFTTTDDAILKCPYPLISIALSAEYLQKLGKLSQKILNKTSSVASELLKLGACIQSSMKDEDILNYFLREQTDYIGRNALEIYAENDFHILLSDIGVGDIVGKMWYGTGHEENTVRFFRLTRILKADMSYEHYYRVISTNYLSENAVYSFQFYHYIKNCSIRFNISSFSTAISTLLYQTIIYFYVNDLQENEKSYLKLLLFSHTMAYSSLTNTLLNVYYHYKTGRRLRVNKVDIITNVIFAFAIFLNIIDFSKLINNNYEDEDKERYNLISGIIYSIIITTAWMRFVNTVLLTNIFGSFFRIIFQVAWHVFAFLLIVFCITFLFAQCFTVFFQKTNDDFEYIYKGFVALFNSAFGIVEFENFREIKIFGYIILMGYTVVSNIMLFNLIVCIVNNLFESFQEKSIAENMSVLILSHERIRWDEKYGLVILLPAPFNLISLIFIFVLVICGHYYDDEKIVKLNYIFSKICYFLIALIYFFFLTLIGIIVYPFALIKSIIYSLYYDSNSTGTMEKIFILVKRPLTLIYYFLEDLFIFWKLVYKKPVINNEKLIKQKIAKEYILALRKVLIKFKYKQKKRIIPIHELYLKLRLIEKKKLPGINESSPISSGSFSPSPNKFNRQSILTFNSSSYHEQLNAKETMKTLISKIVDNEGYIDIDRTLLILPFRVNYSESFLKNLNYINIRIFQRGITKYFFKGQVFNQVYSYKKLQLLVRKLLIKFKLIYHYVPRDIQEIIHNKFFSINREPKFSKSAQAFIVQEQNEEISEYDDTQDFHFLQTLK